VQLTVYKLKFITAYEDEFYAPKFLFKSIDDAEEYASKLPVTMDRVVAIPVPLFERPTWFAKTPFLVTFCRGNLASIRVHFEDKMVGDDLIIVDEVHRGTMYTLILLWADNEERATLLAEGFYEGWLAAGKGVKLGVDNGSKV
jgi:hypothetical protein